MQINREYEQEIDLRDLFFHLVYRWRSILVAALIGALLLGAFQYWRITSIHNEGKLTLEEKQYEIDLEEYHNSIENAKLNIKNYNQLIREKNTYKNESVYMTLDSEDEWVAYQRFYIKMDQSVMDALPEGLAEDPADYVAAVYTSTLKIGLDEEEMLALLGTSKLEYINELVSVWADGGSNTVVVQVIGASREKVTEQLEYFVNRLLEVCQPMAQEVGAHTFTKVNGDVYTHTDSGLSSKQDEITHQITGWQQALKEQRETLNELEDEEEPKEPGPHIKRFAAIGFILGAFLLACFYAVKYILGGKLHAGSEIAEAYSVPVFGEYAKSRARHPGKGLDKLFEQWEFGKRTTDPDTITERIATLLSEQYAGKNVLLTGTLPQASLDAFRSQLEAKLGGAVRLTGEGDFLTRSEAISAANDADAVVLVEEKYVSSNKNIRRMAELLDIGKAGVGGCVII